MLPITLRLGFDKIDAEQAGNKAYSLSLLPAEFITPGGIVVTAFGLETFLKHGEAQGFYDPIEWLARGEFPAPLQVAVNDICEYYTGKVLMVRSSSNTEDSKDLSAAGIFRTEIGIPCKAAYLEKAIRKVWASAFSDKAKIYQMKVNKGKPISMAVLIQPLIQSRASGVAFSKHPITRKGVLIESTVGLGIPLVEGAINPDKFYLTSKKKMVSEIAPKAFSYFVTSKWLDKKAGDRVYWSKGEKEYTASFLRYVSGGIAAVRLDDDRLTNEPSVSNEQIFDIYHACLKLENLFKTPVDIEWTFNKAGLVILQVRPAKVSKGQNAADVGLPPSSGKVIKGTAFAEGVVTGEVVGPSSDMYFNKILCVNELAPSDVGKLISLRGVIIRQGSILGHAAILCRELGIPCVLINDIEIIWQGETVTIDGNNGNVSLLDYDKRGMNVYVRKNY
ncbi:MAG: hypothetical protein JXR32_02520 [Anaerolineaceae bacterium]|nr:hypothetical protein [Anaerolineaceae bacterium]